MTERRLAILSLLLIVPVQSLGAMFGMMTFHDSWIGRAVFAFCKIWLLTFPVLWLKLVEKKSLSFSPMHKGGALFGLGSGVVIGMLIAVFYVFAGELLIERSFFVEKLASVGLNNPLRYVLGSLYWITVNSVLEEYVWRWFCVRQCEALLPKTAAVVSSALFFTLHHIVSMSVYFSSIVVAICSTGIFFGGLIWSYSYVRYRSIWPGYISHAFVDLVIFGIGAIILFG